MCGIAGILHHEARHLDLALLKRMTDTLVHRGPDGEGHVGFSHGGFGHRRLSIIDLEGGAQPMANEDERIWITLNGEIYNFPELRSELEQKGHRFHSRCDTETVVHLYEEEGAAVVRRLRGMFAFGIWDERERCLLLARDRIGKKPLFWFEDARGIFFASELKALLELDNCPREIDPEAIDLYLCYQSIPGERTIFRGVKRLLPGSTLLWTPGGRAKVERYWSADWTRKTNLSYHEAREGLRELLKDAVKCRLISDVPLGAFLSGGVDSSAVVAAMAEVSSAPVKTFSIGFPEKDFTETKYARMVAERFGTEHEEFTVEPKAMEILPKLVWHYDQPYADSSALPTYYVSQMTRQRVTVALNGDGGDEFFGGYMRYRAALMFGFYAGVMPVSARRFIRDSAANLPEGSTNRSIMRKIRRFSAASLDDWKSLNLTLFAYFDRAQRGSMYSRDFRARLGNHDADAHLTGLLAEGEGLGLDRIDSLLRADTLSYLPDTLLVKVDVASMAASLETRSPLLDTEVMEFAASLPSRWKVGLFRSKSILKRAHHGILPDEVLYRPKMGFGVPISHWFRGELYGYLKSVLLDPRSLGRGYFEEQVVASLIEEHRSGQRNNSSRLWALLMLELWHREFAN